MKKSKKDKLSKSQILILILLFVLCVSIRIVFIWGYRKVVRYRENVSAKIYAESVVNTISLSINQYVGVSTMMKELYLEYDASFLKDFNIIGERMMGQNSAITSLFMAKKGIVTNAYPKNVENYTIGFNMLEDPEQAYSSLLAIDSRQITVSGPYKLLEGGEGFVIRNPIYKNGYFDSFSIVILDWERFVYDVMVNIPAKSNVYRFAVWKDDNQYNITDEYNYIFKNCDGPVSKDVTVLVNIPNDIWHLSIEPIGGWKNFSTVLVELLASIGIVVIPMISVFLRQKANAKHMYEASHDDLTGLPSRNEFFRQCEKLFKNNPDKKYNIIAADIENFKVTNSIYGTEKCDEILKYIAEKISEKVQNNICTRFESDHFLYILPLTEIQRDFRNAEMFADEIMKKAPIDNLSIKLGFYGDIDKSIPISVICDRPLMAAKSILHNYSVTVANYDGPLSTNTLKAQFLESSFLPAIKNENFKIWFQPKFDAVSEEIIGAEALVRWIKDDGTVVSPAEFIHVFEDDGLIYKLDLYVFEKVCKMIKNWQSQGLKIVPVSINISRISLQHKNVLKRYMQIVKKTGIPLDYVPLEITESSSIANKQIKQFAEELKESGFKIHMDDFGSGLSSLESVNFLPFDVIKLDKSLIDFIGTPVGEELLRHILELFKYMNLRTIAEGVETKEQLEFLKKLNCNFIQGYLFAAPMPCDSFVEFLKNS